MMIFTDTHTHPYYVKETDEQHKQIARCIETGVRRLFMPCVDVSSMEMMEPFVSQYPDICFPMLGLHPCSVAQDFATQIEHIKNNPYNFNICAIGEIGMDLYWDKTFIAEQEYAFKMQIQWAKELKLPIVIHCRNAFEEVMKILHQEKDEQLKGIFHCFSGSIEQAKRIIDLGFYLGIGGVLTYKNAKLDTVIEQIDLQHIVLETDAPYLSPEPFRGKPNESSYIVYIAQKIAKIKNKNIEDIAQVTTQNSINIFGV